MKRFTPNTCINIISFYLWCSNNVRFFTGIHSGDNSNNIDEPWKKQSEGQKIFTNIVNEHGKRDHQDELVENILQFLNDKTQWVEFKLFH